MGIPSFDFSVKQGNTGTVENPSGLVVTIRDDAGQPRDLSSAEMVFFVHWDNQLQIRLSSAASEVTIEPLDGRVTVPFSDAAAFRGVSTRKSVRYELELRDGADQRTVLEGRISVIEGFNDD